MKRNLTFLVFTVVLIVFGGTQNSFAQSLETAVNNYIAKAAKASDGASEYADARKIVRGDLDGDGDQDAAVQYTLEGFGGGNSFGQMLAVFRNDKGAYKFVSEETVGGKFFYYTSNLSSIKRGKIILATETCAEPPQGICENPKKGIASFVLRGGKLRKG